MSARRLTIQCLLSLLPLASAETLELSPLPEGRTFHRAVALDQQIIVIGGLTGQSGKGSQRADLLDLETGKWSTRKLPFKPEAILLPAVIGKQIYVLDPGPRVLRRYDLKKDQWTKLESPSTSRTNASLAAFQGKLWLIGGYNEEVTKEKSVESYDPESDSWQKAPPLPDFEKTDHFHLAATIGDQLHVVGHYFGGKSHWAFDGSSWTRRADAPAECGWKSAALAAADGRLFLIQSPLTHPEQGKDGVFTYSPDEDRWDPAGAVPDGFPFILAADASTGKQIFILGGQPAPSAVFVYDVATRRWHAPTRPDARKKQPAKESGRNTPD